MFLHAGDQWIRGSENVLLTVLRGLDRKRLHPVLVTNNAPLARLAGEIVSTFVYPLPNLMYDDNDRSLNVVGWMKSVATVAQSAIRQKSDVIYCNGGSTCQIGYYVGKVIGAPVIGHVHSPYNRRYVLAYRLHRANRVLFVSDSIQRSIRSKQRFHGHCNVIHNGVDVERFQPPPVRDSSWRMRLGIPTQSIVFGQVSSLITRKGIDVLLRAFAILSRTEAQARLVIVGEGPDRQYFENIAREDGISDIVRFVGEQDPRPYYQHVFDVHVLASRSDAFPLSPLEASASGLPGIGADVGGIPEQIAPGISGLLFAPENHEMLAAQMSLLAKDASYRRALGERARTMAVERFSIERFCESVQNCILSTAGAIQVSGDSSGACTERTQREQLEDPVSIEAGSRCKSIR